MWTRNGETFAAVPMVALDGRRIYNPTPAQIVAAGYEIFAMPPDPGEWVRTSDFIAALETLVPAATIAAVLQSPDALKPAVAGLAMLSSDAAPDGRINIADPRVAAWLGIVGVTLDQVREALNPPAPEPEPELEPEIEPGGEI